MYIAKWRIKMDKYDDFLNILDEKFRFYNRQDKSGEFPWDRGYRTGYATALKNIKEIFVEYFSKK